jgi:ribosomal protein S6--L-glutamate ligase
MKLTLLSRSARVPSTARIVEEARARGHKVHVLNPVKAELVFETTGQTIFHNGKRVVVGDVVVPRLAGSITAYGLAVVEQFVMRGAIAMNEARAIARSRNPMRCLQVLAANGIEIPPTRMVHEARDLQRLSKSVGGFPLLVKTLSGAEKNATMVFESRKSLQAGLEAVLGLGHDLVLQQYLKKGREVRVWVIGGRAVCAVRPEGKKRVSAAALTPALTRAAERAARALPLELCTVDVFDNGRETFVTSLNAVPALPESEKATKVNLAEAVVLRAEALYEKGRLKAVGDKE